MAGVCEVSRCLLQCVGIQVCLNQHAYITMLPTVQLYEVISAPSQESIAIAVLFLTSEMDLADADTQELEASYPL